MKSPAIQSPTTPPASPIRVGILGAGPAGLVTALALERYVAAERIEISILDQNASAVDYPGVEYGIQQRACLALERIGLLEQALARANPCHELAFYQARLNKRFRTVQSDPHYTRTVVRQEFLADLCDLLTRTKLLRKHLVDSVSALPNRAVRVNGTQGTDAVPFSHEFDVVIAADGVRSVVRSSLFPEYATIHDRGFSCIYMLVDGAEGHAPADFLARANSGRNELVMGNFATLTMFPLGKGRIALGIGFDHATKAKLWAEHGVLEHTDWADLAPATKKAIATRLAEDAPVPDLRVAETLGLVPDWNSYKIYLWKMRDSDPLPHPYADAAGIVLLGDAAHAMMPTIGMGASLAIEDAEALARVLSVPMQRSANVESFRSGLQGEVFAPFAAARVPVWNDLMQRARLAAASNFIDIGRRKRFAVGPQIPGTALSRIVTLVESVADAIGM